MNPSLKKELKSKLLTLGHEFDLNDIIETTFVVQIDRKTQISAFDMVYAVSAILESPKKIKQDEWSSIGNKKPDSNNLIHQRVGALASEELKKEEQLSLHERLHQIKFDNFFSAMDALDSKKKKLLETGIE